MSRPTHLTHTLAGQGWADPLLKTLGYNQSPGTLQVAHTSPLRPAV